MIDSQVNNSNESTHTTSGLWNIREGINKLVLKWQKTTNQTPVPERLNQTAEIIEVVKALDQPIEGELPTVDKKYLDRFRGFERKRLLADIPHDQKGMPVHAELRKYYYEVRQKFGEDKVHSSVDRLIDRYGLVVLHGITGISGRMGGDWSTKLNNVLINPRAEVCCSTFFPDEFGNKRPFTHEGVILSSGEVTAAGVGDVMSQIENDGTRTTDRIDTNRNITEQVKPSIKESNGRDIYNEVFIKNIGISGYYFEADKGEVYVKQEKIDYLNTMGIKIYCTAIGGIYEAEYDGDTGILKAIGEALNPVDLGEEQYTLPPEERKRIVEEFSKDFPFTYATEMVAWHKKGENYPQEQNSDEVRAIMKEEEIGPEQAVYLYAYADAIEKTWEMHEQAEKAREKARTVLSEDRYKEFQRKVYTNPGKITMMPEEVEDFLTTGKVDWFGDKETLQA